MELAPAWRTLTRLTPHQVDHLISDVELLRQGARIHYCIDSHEIFDFCFPVNPDPSRRLLSGDVNQVADDQAALYELFYVLDQKPLLVPEYSEEAVGLLKYLESFVQRAYSQNEIVRALIQNAPHDQRVLESPESSDGVLEVVKASFTLVLAVNLGLLTIGVQRFSDIINRHVSLDLPKFSWRQKKTSLPGFHRSRVAWQLFEDLGRQRASREDYARLSSFDRQRRERADLVDATVVDRLLFTNQKLEELYEEGRLTHRHLMLYVSSAPKTQRLFRNPIIHDELPRIQGERYPIWRTREQLLALAACRGSGKGRFARLSDSLSRLRELREVVDEIEGVRRLTGMEGSGRCESCLIEGGAGINCRVSQICERVRRLSKALEKRRAELQNLGFVAELDRYRSLLDVHASRQSEEVYVKSLHAVFSEAKVRDRALEAGRLIQQLVGIKSLFAKYMPAPSVDVGYLEARGGKDAVTSPEQALPLRPCLRNRQYIQLVDDIRSALRDPLPLANSLSNAYEKFTHLDLDVESGALYPEHEIVRTLLYMASLVSDSGERAADHAGRMRSLLLADWLEFAYLEVWALRRVKKYREADVLVAEAISRYPSDARLYHGRALNAFSWRDEQGKFCPRSQKEIRADFAEALRLYLELRPSDREMIAVLYNDLAYTWCLEERRSRQAAVEARTALNGLKDWKDKSDWRAGFPEYHHTEAAVEYLEFEVGMRSGERPELLRRKLAFAYQEISIAMNVMPKPAYLELHDKIVKQLDNFGVGKVARRRKDRSGPKSGSFVSAAPTGLGAGGHKRARKGKVPG